ncbi:MAG TPA: hypothetical protein VF100_06320, partial [Thermoanaerobaculia bacterium]
MQRIHRPAAVAAAVFSTTVLAACATGVTPPALPDDHPASPAAPAAAPTRPSGLLARAAPIPAGEPEVMDEGHAHGEPGDPAHSTSEPAAPAEPDAEPEPHHGHDQARPDPDADPETDDPPA